MAATLAACGSNTGRGGDKGGPMLSHWYHQYGEQGVEQAVRRYAASYPKANVQVQWRPGDYDRTTATALLTDDGPDVFETDGPTIDQIQAGQVADLTDAVRGAEADFDPVVLAQKTHNGRVYAIPQTIDMQLLYYRPSLLARANLAPPATLDQLVTAARTLTTPEVKGLFLGNDGGAGALGATPLYAAGLSLVTPDGQVGFDDPAAAAAAAKLHTLYADGSLLLGAPSDWSAPAAFTQGLTAMQWSGLWALPAITAALGGDVGVLPFPSDGPHGRPAVPVGAYACAVSTRTKAPDLARDYARWLWVDRVDYQSEFASAFGLHIPARRSLAAKSDRLRAGPAGPITQDAVRFTAEHGYALPLLWTSPARTALQDALTRIIQGGADPVAEMGAAVRTARSELVRVRAKN